MTKEKLTEQLSAKLNAAFPGTVFNFSQMISDNVEEAVSGVKGENSIKMFGPDLRKNEANADHIVDVMSQVPGVKDLGHFKSLGQPSIRITPNRQVCARYGLNTGDVDSVIEAAIGGKAITQVYEAEKHFDLTVRWLPQYRASLEAIREITIASPDGTQIPLGQLADIRLEDGPATIYREDGVRYSPVKFSVRGRDLVSTINDAKNQIEKGLPECATLPQGTTQPCRAYDQHMEWAGEMNQLQEATERLMIILPLSFLLIGFLVYGAVKNWVDSLIVFLNIPVASAGGILALIITGNNFSVSAAMGFISIFGIAVQDAILVVTYFQRLRNVEGLSVKEAAREAAEKRLRPCLMTTLVAMIGLFPAALSNGIGSQTQKPLALVVIGGALILALVARAVQPPLLVLAHGFLERRRNAGGTPSMRPPPMDAAAH